MDEVIVSIKCLVYNHAPYLRECLDGFVMQKANFKFEAIVHDDASTDGSADIIKEYAEKYPNIIIPIYEVENQYAKRDGSISRIMRPYLKGKYIAYCEGDDYWIDPYKLQKQVDYLEANNDVVFTVHRFRVYLDEEKAYDNYNRVYPIHFNRLSHNEQTLKIDPCTNFHIDWLVQTLTAVIRKENYLMISEQISRFKYFRDVHLFYLLLLSGRGVCLNFVGGVYRKNNFSTHIGASIIDRLSTSLYINEELFLSTRDTLFLYKHMRNMITLLKFGEFRIVTNSFKRLYPKCSLILIKAIGKRFCLFVKYLI